MKNFKRLFLFYLLTLLSSAGFAQKQIYDVDSFIVPQGWQQQQVEGGVQLFVTDNKTGSYAIAIVTKAMSSTGLAAKDFKNQWKSLLVNTVNSITEPVMTAPTQDNGWEILSGNGNYIDKSVKGLATLITATGYNQTVAVVLMTNTQQYQSDMLTFINSLSLKKFQQNDNAPGANTQQPNANKTLAGSWSYSVSEKQFGTLSPGYSTRQYTFKEDGTYSFLSKYFSSTMNALLFQYEIGSYSLSGNQLAITPTSGFNEEWSKDSIHPDQWGTRLKTSQRKLERVTYTFTLRYFSGIQETNLILQTSNPTEREGAFSNVPDYPNGWLFKPCNTYNNPVIITPSGFSVNAGVNANPQTMGTTNTQPIVGLWVDYILETSGYVNGMPMYSAGYFRKEYLFNEDGTYVFRLKNWSVYMKEILFIYESGSYSVSGNQLTISPKQGKGEWWSKAASNKTNEWGKLVRASEYKLEKVTYSFDINYFSGSKDSLTLKPGKPTQRDGGNFNNANDPFEFRYSLRENQGTLINNPPGF